MKTFFIKIPIERDFGFREKIEGKKEEEAIIDWTLDCIQINCFFQNSNKILQINKQNL